MDKDLILEQKEAENQHQKDTILKLESQVEELKCSQEFNSKYLPVLSAIPSFELGLEILTFLKEHNLQSVYPSLSLTFTVSLSED